MRPRPRPRRRPHGPGAPPLSGRINDALLTIPMLRERYGRSDMFWYRRARAGELAGAVLLNNRWYVRRLVFERWLAGDDAESAAGSGSRLRAV